MNLEYFKRKFDTLYKQNDTKREDIAAKTGIDKNGRQNTPVFFH